MTRTLLNALAIVALLAGGLIANGARAQSSDATPAAPAAAPAGDTAKPMAKPKPKRRAAAPSATIDVTVTNHRSIGLTELDAGPSGSPAIKKVLKNLAAGRKAVFKLPRGEDCNFDLHGIYDDGTSTNFSAVDLCNDNKVNLVD